MSIKSFPLSDGHSVPWVGFGTGTAFYQQDCTVAVARAINAGFTHLDGAQMYHNEHNMGTAITQAGVPRESLFVTTKLDKLAPGESVEESLRKSLERLQLSYVDLFLVHVPTPHKEREGGIKGVWREMVGVKEKGLARSIGVSNFSVSTLEELLGTAKVIPAVNQVQMHPFLPQNGLKALCDAKGIHLTAYSPIGECAHCYAAAFSHY